MSVRRLTEEQWVDRRERLIGAMCEILRGDVREAVHFQNALASLMAMHHEYRREVADSRVRCVRCGDFPAEEG